MVETGQDTRSRLIETAGELLWERSFHSTGVDEICRRAGARRGSFYHFFPSKTDLAIEAIRENWAHVRERFFEPALQGEDSGIGQLEAVARAVDGLQREEFERRGVYLGCPFGGVGQEMAHQDRRLQAVVDEIFEEHARYFLRALETAAENGEIEPGDLRRRARNVLALLEGALLVAKVGNAPDRFTEVIRLLPLVAARDAA
jgi:TetR/AcrR family transcriptional repressor of nem operon